MRLPEDIGIAGGDELLNELNEFIAYKAYSYIGHAFGAIQQLIEWLVELIDLWRIWLVLRERCAVDLVVEFHAHAINAEHREYVIW